ncbi:DUF4097 family beta strand repeat-containing protein [Bacillus cytotoxicus]|uniref:DUF4097 family beta strand repeat-containing protein n=1 Tax=Bacillus cytotoxicus TaxID=580165 RepID=UPI0024489BDB|nr:DUF4097 family beta strand repeat-containing protein [Bacillus cytotoxicus]MDH2881810.1 DUF4097 domain-containing protein [Bacillus cytotoxicus]
MKKIMLVAIVCIVVGIIGISQTYSEMVDAAEQKETEKVIKNEAIKNVDIELDAGDIVIQKGKDSSFYVKQSGNIEKQRVSVNEEGDVLGIKGKTKEGFLFDFSFLSSGFKATKLTVVVPERTYQEIKMKSSAGEITISEVKSERVEALTLAGDVAMERVTAKTVEGSSKAGEVEIKRTNGKVVAKTARGDVKVMDHDAKYDLEANSEAGDIDIRLLEKPQNAVVSGKTYAGEVEIFQTEDRNVTFGDGSVKITGKTAAGDVSIQVN